MGETIMGILWYKLFSSTCQSHGCDPLEKWGFLWEPQIEHHLDPMERVSRCIQQLVSVDYSRLSRLHLGDTLWIKSFLGWFVNFGPPFRMFIICCSRQVLIKRVTPQIILLAGWLMHSSHLGIITTPQHAIAAIGLVQFPHPTPNADFLDGVTLW